MLWLRCVLSYGKYVNYATPLTPSFASEGNELPPAGDTGAESPKNDLCPTPRRMSFNVSWNYGRQGLYSWGLTCAMSGGPKGAKRPLERPLDGGVRPRL